MIAIPEVGTRSLAREAVGWDIHDPDLRTEPGLGSWVVELQMVGTADHHHWADSEDLIEEYEALYRRDGLAALPPVWAWEGGPYPTLITGLHRSTAAHQAGYREIPAWVVLEDQP